MQPSKQAQVAIALNPGGRIAELEKLAAALQKETDRGKACVADAVIDALLEELFATGLLASAGKTESGLNYATRLRLAGRLGWIGEETQKACAAVHKVRNTMAHELESDSFDQPQVAALVDALPLHASLEGVCQKKRGERFIFCVLFILNNLWKAVEKRSRPQIAADAALLHMRIGQVQSETTHS